MLEQDAKTELRKLARMIVRQYKADHFTKAIADSEKESHGGCSGKGIPYGTSFGKEYERFYRVVSA